MVLSAPPSGAVGGPAKANESLGSAVGILDRAPACWRPNAASACSPRAIEGNTNAEWFNVWLKDHLLRELPSDSILIMDNAAFHKTPKTRALIEQAGHTLLYLPPYSPDFNPIEQDFATMKKRRQYTPPETTLDEIIRDYGT